MRYRYELRDLPAGRNMSSDNGLLLQRGIGVMAIPPIGTYNGTVEPRSGEITGSK